MSSHHIIRDEQEPALLLQDTACCSYELIQQLLEWSPSLAVTEEVIPEVLNWGIKIEIVFCRSENMVYLMRQLQNQIPVEIVPLHGLSYLEKAIHFFAEKKYPALNIISAFDKESIPQELPEKPVLMFFDQDYKIFYCRQGKWSKWVASNAVFRMYTPTEFESENLTLHGSDLYPAKEGFVKIHAKQPFWLAEKVMS